MVYPREILETECCANCKHYIQHYYRRDGYYFTVHDGHCMHPRIKNRKPTAYCDRFERREMNGKGG